MKELRLENMENLEGAANARCFLFGAISCLASLDPVWGIGPSILCNACLST